MVTVYGDVRSGNCLKVKWILDHLQVPYRWREVDVPAGEARSPALLALNPAGQVPFVQLPRGDILAQSNAIVLHFARGTALVPDDPLLHARMMEWLFWEQYSHEPYIAVRRFQMRFLGKPATALDPRLLARGSAALRRMNDHLEDRSYLVGEAPSAADLCLLPYTRLAGEGGFDLSSCRALPDWIARSERAFGIGDPSACPAPAGAMPA